MMAGYIAVVQEQQRSLPAWLGDARLWCTIFVVLFWPVVFLAHLPGVIVLLVVVFGAWLLLQSRVRRADDAAPN
jgi:hypothetical protein